ncbi:Dcp2, box A domain-containing protein [Lipomyces oligophaga]|uniref:Dcp2, box A domain-containing protein n=1 Tax=Lipomyces oligophaga TaxID=45792 RepID=UPI0034CFBDAB
MSIRSQFQFDHCTLNEVLDDLCVRFIINCPPDELASVERVCFQAEEAHWFYEDFIRAINPELPSLSQKIFTARLFAHCPLLQKWSDVHEQAFADFMQYKFRVPVRGAIILDKSMDHCLLVRGWKSSAGWGFPKGKINQNEADEACAVREVIEETGYDVSPLLKKDQYVEATIREQQARLYIIVGVPMDTVFHPQTRKEIGKVDWFELKSLPSYHATKDGAANEDGSLNSKKFYMVAPFLKQLMKWVQANKKKDLKGKKNMNPSPASTRKSRNDGSVRSLADETMDSSGENLQSVQPQAILSESVQSQAIQPQTVQAQPVTGQPILPGYPMYPQPIYGQVSDMYQQYPYGYYGYPLNSQIFPGSAPGIPTMLMQQETVSDQGPPAPVHTDAAKSILAMVRK